MGRMKRKGKIVPNGVVLEKHEMATVVFLTELGIDIELIPRSKMAGVRTADIKITGEAWEMKAPKGEGNALMKNTLQKAARQSEFVIVDLRRTKRHSNRCLAELKREFVASKRLRRMKVITKQGKILDFAK